MSRRGMGIKVIENVKLAGVSPRRRYGAHEVETDRQTLTSMPHSLRADPLSQRDRPDMASDRNGEQTEVDGFGGSGLGRRPR